MLYARRDELRAVRVTASDRCCSNRSIERKLGETADSTRQRAEITPYVSHCPATTRSDSTHRKARVVRGDPQTQISPNKLHFLDIFRGHSCRHCDPTITARSRERAGQNSNQMNCCTFLELHETMLRVDETSLTGSLVILVSRQ